MSPEKQKEVMKKNSEKILGTVKLGVFLSDHDK